MLPPGESVRAWRDQPEQPSEGPRLAARPLRFLFYPKLYPMKAMWRHLRPWSSSEPSFGCESRPIPE